MAPDWPRRLREDGDCHRAGIRVRKQAETIQRGDDVTQQRGRSRRNGSGGCRNARGRKYAIADFARELLAVADNLQRTIAAASRHSPETVEDQALIEGVRATERLLEHTFSRFGIQKIDALGKPFDPTLHEAMMEVDDPSQPPGTVIRVAEDGYKIHDRLLRQLLEEELAATNVAPPAVIEEEV